MPRLISREGQPGPVNQTRYPDPAPLSFSQLSALTSIAARELGWGLRIVRATVEHWQARALTIPDPVMRRNAVAALRDKRPLVDGAALFWILPKRRQPDLVRLLATFQILANFHDHAGERAGGDGASEEPAGSMLTLNTIVDLDHPWAGYFSDGAAPDGGYLDALAQTCRSAIARLPRYRLARAALLEQTYHARAMDIEHTPDHQGRTQRLQHFAASEFGSSADAEWWEVAAGASSLLTVIATLALAADEQTTTDDINRAVDAYIWVGSLGSLLDSYIDQLEDTANGGHNYLNYYATPAVAEERLATAIERALRAVGALHRGEHHLVIVASMTAMYLTSESARSGALRASTDALAARSGTLTRLLIPLLRAWRIAYRESDA